MKVLMTIVYFILISQGFFYFGLILPRDAFDEEGFPYRPFKWENDGKIYNKFRIKKWKSCLPDMSMITNLLFPKKVPVNINVEQLDRLIKESCVAEMIHYILCVLSIGFYRIWSNKIGVILSVLYFAGNLPYIMIQRYNRPNFISLRNRMKIREERIANAGC